MVQSCSIARNIENSLKNPIPARKTQKNLDDFSYFVPGSSIVAVKVIPKCQVLMKLFDLLIEKVETFTMYSYSEDSSHKRMQISKACLVFVYYLVDLNVKYCSSSAFSQSSNFVVRFLKEELLMLQIRN